MGQVWMDFGAECVNFRDFETFSPHLLIFWRKPWILPEFLDCLNQKYKNTSPQNEQGILVFDWLWSMLKIWEEK